MTLLLLLRCHRYGAAPSAPSTGQRGLNAQLAEIGSRQASLVPANTRSATMTPVKPPGGTIS